MFGDRTVDMNGAKTVIVKSTEREKSRFTFVLSCLANGIILKPMVIFKRKTMTKIKFPPGVIVHIQENGWMDESSIEIWLSPIWDKRPDSVNNISLLEWDMLS